MSAKNIAELLERYELGRCTPEEIVLVEEWFDAHGEERNSLSTMEPGTRKIFIADLLSDIQQINKKGQKLHIDRPYWHFWLRAGIAASFLLVLGAAVYIYQQNKEKTSKVAGDYAADILPGGNKAVLTLANGKRIILNEAKIGDLENQSGVRVTKAANGKLVFHFDNSSISSNPSKELNSEQAYTKIETPKGGEYEVNLPDGTKIWLNAASSLSFPSHFAKAGERTVQLKGEGYFEVAKNARQPFVVVTDRQRVQVLGTHFNVNSYSDEPGTKTTLLEGSVAVTPIAQMKVKIIPEILKPGQQAVFNGDQFQVIQVHAEDAIAWKNGVFLFKEADFKTVMRTIARWYDVDVEYDGKLPQKEFTGEIHRNLKLSSLLDILSFYKVHFRIENKKIIVTR
ncbi:hypothetical protein DBR11_18090 [Pedobacter sp. HMWF019]|uniref:FecR family protein n=1 Tax=Pedobacter sp. HMWF019 TaxID=2056856 RepID=UPI000D372FB6|nr:FecR family protein [Pedobacter sp. HMWF019]PTS97112.1 hypothetical protein DBR11_18090 [Pedobacter sp. HMWF019]